MASLQDKQVNGGQLPGCPASPDTAAYPALYEQGASCNVDPEPIRLTASAAWMLRQQYYDPVDLNVLYLRQLRSMRVCKRIQHAPASP
jgi:hypothetical protein